MGRNNNLSHQEDQSVNRERARLHVYEEKVNKKAKLLICVQIWINNLLNLKRILVSYTFLINTDGKHYSMYVICIFKGIRSIASFSISSIFLLLSKFLI